MNSKPNKFAGVRDDDVRWMYLCTRGHAHFIDPRIKEKYSQFKNLVDVMESRLPKVKEPEPRSAEAASYANAVVNPDYREISTLDRRCNRIDLIGTLDPVVVPLPISAARFLTLFLPKLAAEGIQIHCEDIETIIHDKFMGIRVVSNQEAIDNLRQIGVNVDVVGQIQMVKVVSIRPIEEDLGIVEDMGEVSIGRPRTPPPIPDPEFVEKQIIEEEVQTPVEHVEQIEVERNELSPPPTTSPIPADFPPMFHESEEEEIPEIVDTAAVSYTHLTLPTIYSV